MMSVMCASLTASAAKLSHPRADPSLAADAIAQRENDLYGTAFPYMPKANMESRSVPDIDSLFDELDEIEAAEKRNKLASGPDEPHATVGDGMQS